MVNIRRYSPSFAPTGLMMQRKNEPSFFIIFLISLQPTYFVKELQSVDPRWYALWRIPNLLLDNHLGKRSHNDNWSQSSSYVVSIVATSCTWNNQDWPTTQRLLLTIKRLHICSFASKRRWWQFNKPEVTPWWIYLDRTWVEEDWPTTWSQSADEIYCPGMARSRREKVHFALLLHNREHLHPEAKRSWSFIDVSSDDGRRMSPDEIRGFRSIASWLEVHRKILWRITTNNWWVDWLVSPRVVVVVVSGTWCPARVDWRAIEINVRYGLIGKWWWNYIHMWGWVIADCRTRRKTYVGSMYQYIGNEQGSSLEHIVQSAIMLIPKKTH